MEILSVKDDSAWDTFISSSPQKNVYSKSFFLKLQDLNFLRYFVIHQKKIVLAAVLIEPNTDFLSPAPYSQYQGIFYPKPEKKKTFFQAIEFKALTFFIDEILKKNKALSFSLHHSIKDIRPFQWFNYDEPAKGMFKTNLRYSACVNLSNYNNFDNYLSSIRKCRRDEYKKAISSNFTWEVSLDIDIFLSLYIDTFKRQDISISNSTLNFIRRIVEKSLDNKKALLFLGYINNEAVASNVFLIDDQIAYYQFGASNPIYRNKGSSSALMICALRYLYDNKINEVDFVGVNSPNRGDFKLSFNSELVQFFNMSFGKE